MRKQPLHPRTEVLNIKQKNLSKKSRIEALSWLATRFPEAFDSSTRVRPLKIGIMHDILTYANEANTAGISKSKLREAVVRFTRRTEYLTCLKAREPRIDLFGNYGEIVSEDDALKAAQKIKLRIEKSIKNTKKLASTSSEQTKSKTAINIPKIETPLYSSSASDKPIAYNMQNNFSHTSRTSQQVMIKHKQTRQYDPEAVARLKEKLGISQQKKSKYDI